MADLNIPNLKMNSNKYIFKKKLSLRRKTNKRLKKNIKADSINNLLLDFLVKLSFFLKIYLLEFIFKLGIFNSAINQSSKNKLIIILKRKLTYTIVFVFWMLINLYFGFISSFFSLSSTGL